MKNNNIVICDGLIGDTGKGRYVDWYVSKGNINTIVKYTGGSNAGHTIVVNDKKTIFHLMPSGALHPGIVNVIATGVCVDPVELKQEIAGLEEQKMLFTQKTLKVSTLCPVITRIHKAIDAYEEEQRGTNKIGTTKKGIGPVNIDRYGRRGLRLIDLLNVDKIRRKITQQFYINALLKYNLTQSYDNFIDELHTMGKYLEPYLTDTSLYLDGACKNGGVLFEGSQSALLDVDSCMTPFTTSTHTSASYAAVGSGISAKYLDEVVGVVKAFTTRVGGGVFITEMNEQIADHVREIGKEYGSTSGRARRIGWLDLVLLKYSSRINGFTSLALTKLDTLSGLEELKICTHYTINGEKVEDMPTNYDDIEKAIPNYITLKGWKEDLTQITDIRKLPKEVFDYIQVIEDFIGLPVELIGVGPNRHQTLELK
jgi:adenylosuccinate synthase